MKNISHAMQVLGPTVLETTFEDVNPYRLDDLPEFGHGEYYQQPPFVHPLQQQQQYHHHQQQQQQYQPISHQYSALLNFREAFITHMGYRNSVLASVPTTNSTPAIATTTASITSAATTTTTCSNRGGYMNSSSNLVKVSYNNYFVIHYFLI
jgi:hypothetical protein